MADPTPPPTLEAEGVIVGLMDLAASVTWGAIELRPEGDDVRFTMSINIDGKSDREIELIAGRIGPAMEAAVSANCQVAVKAHVQEISRPREPGLRRVTKLLRTSWDDHVLAKTDSDSVKRASAAAQFVLGGGRPQELYEVYRVGVQAMQTIAPVVGLWAFTVVVEEAHPDDKQSLEHASRLAVELRAKGYMIPPDPNRNPAEIRAAALHSAPKSHPPTLEEVSWFRDLAWAYLCDQAASAPSPL